MTDVSLFSGYYFTELIKHLEAFSASQRQTIAKIYGAQSAEPVDIANHWITDQSNFLYVLSAKIRTQEEWDLLEDLAIEHDMPVDVGWVERSTRDNLKRLGLLNAKVSPQKGLTRNHVKLPYAVAVLVAPKIHNITRPSLALLLGRASVDDVNTLAIQYNIPTNLSKAATILGLAEHFSDPVATGDIVALLPDSEWIAAAMMVLELGGICYWQEIFGHDVDDAALETSTVVPMMRRRERSEEMHIAQTLMDMGILFRIDDQEIPYPLVAVPEELWLPLWSIGRRWLMEWLSNHYFELKGQAIKRLADHQLPDLQTLFKWMICELEHQPLSINNHKLSDDTLNLLQSKAQYSKNYWERSFAMALELRILCADKNGNIVEGSESQHLLNMPRAAFIRETLLEWCTGFTGESADSVLPQAIGLDEKWRAKVVEVLHEQEEFVPVWLHHEGVPSHTTGSGVLRNIEDSVDDILLLEMGFTNAFVWGLKILWLDLLSVLDGERWYPKSSLVELFQLSASYALFSQLVHILEHPQFGFYLPLQRASFFTDPFHTVQFEQWIDAIATNVFEPLGVAIVDNDQSRVWLDTKLLRVTSPVGWSDEQRIAMIQDILLDDTLDFRIPKSNTQGLRPVVVNPGVVDNLFYLDAPLDVVRSELKHHEVVRFDGKAVYLAPIVES